ncbi:GtrA family protein [Halioxenophilus aromaticivorans]|uniref:GtrA/DPMS transmembrane domain-containing protein n=1 Tax=Halioxenophilus aromaticivorans TaxID=1306992 RepID=A0AAV3U791_9ALTE
MKQLLLYSIASSFGFVVDLCAFVLLSQWLHIYPARLFAFLLSVAFTYEINNRITFTGNGKRWLYVLGQCKGFLINFGLFVWVSQALNELAWGDYIAFAVGCFAALLFNFFFARRFVFSR